MISNSSSRTSKSRQRVVIFAVFSVFVVAGFLAFTHYGVAWNEIHDLVFGKVSLNHAQKLLAGGEGESAYMAGENARRHGPAFHIILEMLKRTLSIRGTRNIFFSRHLFSYLFFVAGAYIFYRFCLLCFCDWKKALLGTFFLVLHPRIFAHAFYNGNDIPFMWAFVASIYTLLRLINRPTVMRAMVHALACGFLVAIRIAGLFVPLLTMAWFIYQPLWTFFRRKQITWHGFPWVVFVGACPFFIYLFWPYLWNAPFSNFLASLNEGIKLDWDYEVLYFGERFSVNSLPWHYNFVWIGITTPLLYLAASLWGILLSGSRICRKIWSGSLKKSTDWIVFVWLGVPLLLPVVTAASLYDGWRHHYFIYPAICFFAVHGVSHWFEIIGAGLKSVKRQAASRLLAGGITAYFIWIVISIINLHPFEGLYFNRLMGSNFVRAQSLFEFDYLGTSYRRALEHILAIDAGEDIRVFYSTPPGLYAYLILHPKDQGRLWYKKKLKDADYYVTNEPLSLDAPAGPEIYAVRVGGAKAAVVYRVPET